MKNKLLFLGIFFSLIVLGILAFSYFKPRCVRSGPVRGPCQITVRTPRPIYVMSTGYFDSSYGYACSRPISMVSNTMDLQGNAIDFLPVNPSEARLFCPMNVAIEYKGKITVLQKPEVLALISKYDYKDINIKALEFEYIQDKGLVNRLLPTYRNREIGCIIVLETPMEKLVYLEDEDLETFEAIDYKIFEQNLQNVSKADRELFLNNLQ